MPNDIPSTREEFLGFFNQPSEGAVDETSKNTTLTQKSLNAIMGTGVAARLPVPESQVQAAQMGARPGVELDIESGIPAWVQFSAEMNRREQDQLKYYKKVYGDGNVDVSPEGGFVIRNIVNPQNGMKKDILVHPKGLGIDDAITLSTQTPEILAGILAARSGNGKGAWEATKAIAKMAGATELVGGMKDAAVREIQGNPVELSEIGKARAALALVDSGSGALAGTSTKLLSRIITPFSNKGATQAELDDAIKYLSNVWGENINPTPGQATGSGLLLRMEARSRQMPGSALPFEKMEAETEGKIQRLLKKFLGIAPDATEAQTKAAIGTSEDVGERAMGSLGAKINTEFEAPVERARQAAMKSGTAEVESLTGTTRGTPVLSTDIGKAKRAKTVSEFDTFKAQADADYDALLSNPLVQDRNMPGKNIAKNANGLINEFPTKVVTKEEATGLVDKSGKAITRTVTGEEVLHEFVPPGVEKRLREMASWGDQKFKLNDLKQIRTEIDNAIAEGLSIPGTKVGYLKQMRQIVSDGIEEGIDGIGDPALKAQWKAVNANYKAGMERFEPPSIRRMLVKPGETTLGDAAIAEDAFNNADIYNQYKKFFGASSPEMQSLKSGIRQKVFNQSFDVGGDYVQAKTFLGQLKNMPDEIRMDVFPNEKAVTQALQASGIAEGAFKVEDLANLAANKSTTYEKVLNLLSAESNRAQAYRTKIIRDVAKGNLNADSIQPSEFVAKFVRQSEPKDIQRVLGMLSDQPELVADIRRRAATDFLQSASAEATDIAALPSPSSDKLAKIFKLNTNSERYRAVLGSDVYDGLNAVRKVLVAGGKQYESFSGAGGLAASTQIGRIFERGEISAIGRAINNWAIATLYTVPTLRKYLANNVVDPASAARAVNAAIASTPFIEAVAKHWNDEKSQNVVMEHLGAMMDSTFSDLKTRNQNQPSWAPPTVREEFMKNFSK